MTNQVERFGECAIINLQTTGFENLSLDKKQLVFHLSEAGLYGRNIFLQQNHEHNLTVKKVLEELYQSLSEKGVESKNFELFTIYLKKFWIHTGIYHGMDNKRFDIEIKETDFKELIALADLTCSDHDIFITKNVLFNSEFTKPLKNIQKSGVDVVAESGGNFYKNLTSEEVSLFTKRQGVKRHKKLALSIAMKALTERKEEGVEEDLEENLSLSIDTVFSVIEKSKIDPPQHGFNTRLVKDELTDEIKEERIFKDGLYGDLVEKIIFHLEKAMSFVENEEQLKSIKTLVDFYETGEAADFDTHSLAWVKDKESEIFFINGLIESYDDPKGVRCTFESIVAFKNPEETAKVSKIIDNIQWFEKNMPVKDEFKKEKASGLSASSVTVASMSGATSPSIPLGICLPNSDWVREKHGSKSVNLLNVENSRGKSDDGIKKEFFLPEYLDIIDLYASRSSSLHTDLHEVAGHGSCKNNAGISSESLDIFYSVIEEARADLVGLYYIGEQELVDFGIIDSDIDLSDFAKAAYIKYMTNGSMLQLKRVTLGDDLAQPHLRNRQLITNWVFENDTKNCVEFFEDSETGYFYIKVHDVKELRVLFGELLGKIQEIKSTGDYDGAQKIVETYGTKVDENLHAEVLDRVSKLNSPSTYGFTTPLYEVMKDQNGIVEDIITYQKDSFIEDQLHLSNKYK